MADADKAAASKTREFRWLYGLVVDKASSANFVPMNDADNWLHLGLGLGMIALGLLASRRANDLGTSRSMDPSSGRG